MSARTHTDLIARLRGGPYVYDGPTTHETMIEAADEIKRLRDADSETMYEVRAEISRATAKFPAWPSDPLHALAVLGEEFGELTKDVLHMIYEPHRTTHERVRTEAIQTAAMALRFLMNLDHYRYVPCAQHVRPDDEGEGK